MTKKINLEQLNRWRNGFAAVALTASMSLSIFFSSAPINATSLNHMPFRRLQHGTSSNWSGYAAYGAANTFKTVSASWKQPLVTCAARQTSYSSFWVGLDGYSDSTVEQIGSEGDCNRGHVQYYVWYEMYPRNSFLVTTLLHPGDNITASVSYQGNNLFQLKLADSTSHLNYATTQRGSAAQLSSAEVVAEAPSSYSGVLPLANYGLANFSSSLANGLPLGSFTSLDPITMIDPYGMKSTPSAFDTTKENFSVTWSAI